MYLNSKLLMNSLYGRFLMKPDLPLTEVVDNNEFIEFSEGLELMYVIDFGTTTLVTYVN